MADQPAENLFNLLGFNVAGDMGPLTFYTSKRGKLTWFAKAPPTSPPTDWQIRQRNKFRLAAAVWSHMEPSEHQQWDLAASRASLCMTGYNLWVHFALIKDTSTIRTIERQTQTSLILH